MYDVYTVKLGDTIEEISKIYNTDVSELISLNGIIDLSNLKVGMKIIVPNDYKNPYRYYTVKKGDTIESLALEHNVDYKLLIKLNGLDENDYIYPNQTLLIPKAGSILYFTAPGDTLSEIAKGLNVSVSELVSQNDNIYLQAEQLIVYKYK